RNCEAAVEMDEMVAALVLTSLSCSPAVQSERNSGKIHGDAPKIWEWAPSRQRCLGDPWKESGDVSDSGSSTTSGHGSATPSPPHRGDNATPELGDNATPSPPAELGDGAKPAPSSPAADDGFDTEPEPARPEEPLAGNPVPVPTLKSVGFILLELPILAGNPVPVPTLKSRGRGRFVTAVPSPGRDGADREEDFYYTEVQLKEEPPLEVAPAGGGTDGTDGTGATRATARSVPIVIQPGPAKARPCQPPLSHSAPGSFWHIQADHAYQQALPSIQIPVSPHIFTSISWAAATSTLPCLAPARSRSLSLSEAQPPPPPPLLVASPPRLSLSTRKTRGDAKKCRKVYGIEHREQWCTACRWKKACQRFLD
ncbi:ZN395 protein, partial [Picathartes gymnocephalus]|nr:ZN395 protein [Picathartes gymnocephalus]